jgi:hypothetical protein
LPEGMTADKQAYVRSPAMAKRGQRMPRTIARGIRHTRPKCPESAPLAPIVRAATARTRARSAGPEPAWTGERMHRTTDRRPTARLGTTPLREAFRRPGGVALRRRTRRFMAALSVATMATIGAMAVPAGAQAATYPTWEELQAAKANTVAGAAAVQQDTALIAQLETNVAVTRAEAELRTD